MKFAIRVPAVEAVNGRSPCGERGLKLCGLHPCRRAPSRSPCGERGLKFSASHCDRARRTSLPVRGAWVEIGVQNDAMYDYVVAPRAGSVG